MKKVAFAILLTGAACGSTNPGYMNTDVLEPTGFSRPVTAGVTYSANGAQMTAGVLTYTGPADLHKTYIAYVDSMREQGWTPATSAGDPTTGMSARLTKDTRVVDLDIKPEGGNLKIVIKVGNK